MATTTVKTKNTRKLKIAHRKWYQVRHRGPKPQMQRMPRSWTLLQQASRLIWRNKWLFAKMLLVFAVLNLLLVRGFGGSSDTQYIKTNLVDAVQSGVDKVAAGIGVAGYLLTSSGTTTGDAASVYQSVLLVIVSLAIIWTIRQLNADAKTKLKMRDAYYRGMAPLVPFICVLLTAALCLAPFAIGATVYSTVVSYGIFNNMFEYGAWLSVLVLLAAVSLRIVLAPLIALYIVTLPDMTPIAAIRSASSLVRYRRWSIILKILFLVTFLFLVGIIIIVPVIFVYAPAAPWVFYMMTLVAILVAHGYLYTLYRELINRAP